MHTMNSLSNCPHSEWQAHITPMSDGRPALRERCCSCGATNGGSNLGIALPMIADRDMPANSLKYKGKTLGEIADVNKSYLQWLVTESKSSDRIKNAAARLYFDNPYTPPQDGEIYGAKRMYDLSKNIEYRQRLSVTLSA